MNNLILFGPPGAGKGTQSNKLIEEYNLEHISTGDLFRKHLSEGTKPGLLAQKYMDEGHLVPAITGFYVFSVPEVKQRPKLLIAL